MGTFHFMGVGKSVGAVTCAVDYIEKIIDQAEKNSTEQKAVIQFLGGSGGIRHNEEDRGKIEALVLFSSKEVITRELKAYSYTGKDQPGAVRDEIETILKQVWRRKDPDQGRKVFWCEVNINNFQECFEKISKVAYRFSPHGKQGKEIWCNLTGGGNALNLALLSMAGLTGKSTRQYLLAQGKQYEKAVRVPSEISVAPNQDGYFVSLPFLKTAIDTVQFYEVLMELESIGQPIKTQDLLSRLKGKGSQFFNLDLDRFKRNYLLKLYGLGYTAYNLDLDTTEITELGISFINELENLETIIYLEKQLMQNTIDIVAESKSWEWFHESCI
jgi:hypothetical protein